MTLLLGFTLVLATIYALAGLVLIVDGIRRLANKSIGTAPRHHTNVDSRPDLPAFNRYPPIFPMRMLRFLLQWRLRAEVSHDRQLRPKAAA
jgi:hypothetical protein